MIERFLTSCFVYLWQLLCLVLPAASIALIVLALTKKKKAAAAVLALCLFLELGAAAWIARHPFFRCPEEYRPQISAEEEARIIGFNNGLWSLGLPVFPVCVTVTQMDESSICVRTKYLFLGTSEMQIGRLGSPDPEPIRWTGLRLW